MLQLAHTRQLTSTVYTTPRITPTTPLRLSIRVLMFEYVRLVTGDWDLFQNFPVTTSSQNLLQNTEMIRFAPAKHSKNAEFARKSD